ncbi:MAG TPA: ATP-binding protein [Methylomirabilota bacterium]|nr:ATP-binding protein [Methylomirabilota bacterium]
MPKRDEDDVQTLWSRVNRLLDRAGGERPDEDELRALAEGFARLGAVMTRVRNDLQGARAQRAAAEAALAEQRQLVEDGPDGYLLTSASGTIRSANAAIAGMLQVPRRFVVGKPLAAFVAPSDLRAFRWRLNNVSDQWGGEWPLRLRPRSGEPMMVGVRVAPITRGSGAPDLRWLVRDISVRERAQALQAANEFTREILGSEQHARTEAERARQRLELLARVSGVLATSINYPAALADITAIVLPLVGDLFLADLQVGDEFIPELSAHADSLLAERLRSIRAGSVRLPDDHPVAVVCRTGQPLLVERVGDEWLAAFAGSPEALATWREVRLISAVIVPIQSHRRRYGALTFGFGLSERRYDLAEVGLFTDIGLRIALAFDTANLVRELEMEHQRKDEFLAMLAHELRNPLYAVTNALAALERASAEDRAHLAEILGRQAQHLAHLVNDLLDVSRIRFGLVSLRRRRLDLRGIVGDAVEVARGRDEGASLSISARLGTRPVVVEADPDRLAQVLGNLLDNALKYTPAGGAVDVSLGTEGNQAVLHVRDTGVGIPLEFQPRVFDVFSRANIQGTQPRTGLGLGLSVVRELVTQHGGIVGVESGGLGQGADFQVRIPLAVAAEPAASGEGRAPGRTPSHALSILVVEDNQDGRETMRLLLEQRGQRVRVARDGREAIEEARARLPEVALIDIGLPDMDGYEVARALRGLPGGAGVRLIALTGYSAQQDRSRAAGFDAHLVKPVTPESLLRLLSEENRD